MARYTVKQMAKMSGVSIRTLHYYDEIGLLRPSDIGDNGYRYYDRPQLLRLQQVLFHRALGLPLHEIGRVLDDPGFDMAAALRDHRQRLHGDIKRIRRLIRTIDETLAELDGDKTMPKTHKNPFKGFAPEKQAQYEKELVDRYGDAARARIMASRARVGKLSEDEVAAIKEQGHQVNLDLTASLAAGASPEDPAVQALVGRHHHWVSHFWTPNAEAYTGLGQLYLDHPDFRAFYDTYDPGLVDFLATAMKVYAAQSLE